MKPYPPESVQKMQRIEKILQEYHERAIVEAVNLINMSVGAPIDTFEQGVKNGIGLIEAAADDALKKIQGILPQT